MKKNILILFIISSILFLTACTQKGESDKYNEKNGIKTESKIDKKIELTDRQKEILTSEGLSTDIDKLEPSQRVGIQRIEELLVKLDKKYNKKFAYKGYISPGLLEKEQLIAYPMDEYGLAHELTMHIDDDGNFEDNYFEVTFNEPYVEYVRTLQLSVITDIHYKFFVEVTKTELKEIPKNPEDFKGKMDSITTIIFQADGKDEQYMKQMESKIRSFAEENKLYGLYDLTFLINVDLKDVSRFNHGRIDAGNIAYSTFVDVKNTDDCR